MPTFAQLGATRDGLDPYLRAAHTHGMEAVLIETPDYIQFRKTLGRREFDQTIAVEHPANVPEVLAVLENISDPIVLILAGFERYIYTAYAIAQKMRILPYHENHVFTPPDKAKQRNILSRRNIHIRQPRYRVLNDSYVSVDDFADMSYPLVIKPVDGGGGLGVFLARDFSELELALCQLHSTTNYDGGDFTGFLIEEHITGTEYSVQGIARKGRSQILTFCKKFIVTEPVKGQQHLLGFREVGHIALTNHAADPEVKRYAQECIDAFGYSDGPFHIDMVHTAEGYHHLEMGFRLSGSGLARLVQRVSGKDWAEESFAAYLGVPPAHSNTTKETCFAGQLTAISNTEIDRAHLLWSDGHAVEIQLFGSSTVPMISQSLSSDINRHSGFVGRITICASTMKEVEHLLQICSPERTLQHVP